jgi:2-amino-4-hydroxy-6-hydroxymethyldihydropteridine diphosphokinase
MLYAEWEPFYKEIIKDFNLNFKDDHNVAETLNKILKKQNISRKKNLKNLIQNNEVIVFGAGPTLKNCIKKNKDKSFFKKSIKISADGATTALIEENIVPDIIVTDLDGKISDQIKANAEGSIIMVHAHGDNEKKIREVVPCLTGEIYGTTQIDPKNYENLSNYGGFTDGDRAVYLADHFKAKKIFLIGFDFNNKIGEYSFTGNKEVKKKKLIWCELLIKRLNNKKIVFL